MKRKYPLMSMTRNGYQYVRLPFGIGYDEILADQKIQFGTPCLRGTRIPVEAIYSRWISGDSIESMARDWNVTEKQIQVAISYYKGE